MERTHKTRAATTREQPVDEVEAAERDEDLLDDIDEILDDIDEVLEAAAIEAIEAMAEMATVEDVVAIVRAEQQLDDAAALAQLGLYSPLDLGEILEKEMNPACKLCGRCPVNPLCAEEGL